jgi:hypothetical protein
MKKRSTEARFVPTSMRASAERLHDIDAGVERQGNRGAGAAEIATNSFDSGVDRNDGSAENPAALDSARRGGDS